MSARHHCPHCEIGTVIRRHLEAGAAPHGVSLAVPRVLADFIDASDRPPAAAVHALMSDLLLLLDAPLCAGAADARAHKGDNVIPLDGGRLG